MRKILCVFLIVQLLLISVGPLGNSALTQNTFEELWQQKIEYEKDMHVTTGYSENMPNVFYEVNWSFVLYTEQGKELTYIMEEWGHGGAGDNAELMEIGHLTLTSPELQKIEKDAYAIDYDSRIGIRKNSAFRELVKALQLTREDVVNAYKKMKNASETARNLLSFLTDEEFNEFVRYSNQYFECPDDFVLDAVFWKDDAQGNALLCKNGSIYLPEYGGVITTAALFDDGAVSYDADFGGFFDGVDLTTREFQYYYENLKQYVYVQRPNYDEYMDGTVIPKMKFLETELEKQLSTKAGREAAFVGELGSMLTADRLFGTAETAPTVTVAELAVCDLTGEDMGNFLDFLRENIESYKSTADPADGRTPLEKLEYLEAQREAQLRAAETGDGMEKAFFVIGIGVSALALLTIVRKKKTI